MISTGKTIQINGTTVIDTSRNLTNIGTISSGDITITGNFPRLYFVDTAGTDLDAYIVNNANGLFFGKTNTPSASNDVMALDLTNKRVTITSSGTIGGSTVANGYLKISDGSTTMGLDSNEVHTTDTLFLQSELGNIRFRGNNSAGTTLWNGGTTFMNASRDLFNIGTISSGTLTIASGSHISFTDVQGDIIKWDSTYLNIGSGRS